MLFHVKELVGVLEGEGLQQVARLHTADWVLTIQKSISLLPGIPVPVVSKKEKN